ncbi:hypothetical protein QQP08_019943 [Theobroma cacao]|nr:hypothetical protein QQP08_019943 [Theobroma cacao]
MERTPILGLLEDDGVNIVQLLPAYGPAVSARPSINAASMPVLLRISEYIINLQLLIKSDLDSKKLIKCNLCARLVIIEDIVVDKELIFKESKIQIKPLSPSMDQKGNPLRTFIFEASANRLTHLACL